MSACGPEFKPLVSHVRHSRPDGSAVGVSPREGAVGLGGRERIRDSFKHLLHFLSFPTQLLTDLTAHALTTRTEFRATNDQSKYQEGLAGRDTGVLGRAGTDT